ncbi:hypothetical protein FRC15_007393 [Serendipita sp. 397]|nr:hypothetical protein FRC15_007393 [Serendipita sp. 397]
MTSRYRPTLLRRDSVSSRWNHKVEEGEDHMSTLPAPPAAIVLPTPPTSQPPSQSVTQLATLKARFHELSEETLSSIISRFHKIPSSKVGWISQSAAITAAQASEGVTYNKARETIKAVRADATDTLAVEDWVEFIARLRSDAPATMVPGTRTGTYKMRGSHAEISHTIDEDERVEFTEYINTALASDPDVGSRLPFPTDTMQIFDECRDGLIICKLVEHIFPGTIDSVMSVRRRRGTSYINLPRNGHPLNKFQIAENNNIAILAAQAIGATVVNMSGQDIAEGREHLILSLIGQIIRQATSDKPKLPPKQTALFTTPLPVRRASLPPQMTNRTQSSPPPYFRSRSMSVSVDDDERAASPKPTPRATSPKPTIIKPIPRPFIIPVRQSPKLAPTRPIPRPLIIPEKDQTPSAGGAGYGIDAGIIAQRQALLQSIKSRA